MISNIEVVKILSFHFLADFVFQSDWMAQNKSKSNWPLLIHVTTYTFVLSLSLIGLWWAILNGCLHFFVDYVTSRITSKFFAEKKVHWAFVVIGFDQLIHTTLLILTRW